MSRDVPQRLRRLLYIVPYVAKHPEGVAVDQLAKMLGAERDELVADLELLSQVGPPDGDPGEYLLVSVEDGRVFVDLAHRLTRPLRLTPAEGCSLLLGIRALRESGIAPFDAAMQSAEKKLLTALGRVDRIALLEEVQRSQSRATTDRIAAERTGVAAAGPIHYFILGDHRSQRHSAGNPLGQANDVRFHPPVLDRKKFASPAHASLDFVDDQEHAVAITQVAQRGQEVGRRNMITAFALDRLDKYSRYLVGRGDALENCFLDLCDAAAAEIRYLPDLGTAGIRDMVNIRDERRKAAAMDELGAGQRHAAVGPDM